MSRRRTAIVPWAICVASASATAFAIAGYFASGPAVAPSHQVVDLAWQFMTVMFGVLGALILSRQPDNRIGWLLMVLPVMAVPDALLKTSHLHTLTSAPVNPSLTEMLGLWFDRWAWVPPIFAILLLPLLYPNGRPPSTRWRWVLVYGLTMAAFFIVLSTFSLTLRPNVEGETWSVRNPIGFIPDEAFTSAVFFPLWGFNLVLLTALSVAGLIVRYRSATTRVRQQIKLLLYGSTLFAVIYIGGVFLQQNGTTLATVWSILFPLGVMAIPTVIALSILRHQLFDIDLVIRRTLVYGILTVALALLFFGIVLAMQRLFTTVTGQQSPVAIVASTLAIAALFAPLRRRVQNFVDRRFYRRKYDAEQILAHFATIARDETDLDKLASRLAAAVDETLQPNHVDVRLTSPTAGRRG